MKKTFYIFVLAVLFAACTNDKKTANTSQSAPSVETSLQSKLQETEPLTSAALKAAFPQQLYDLKLDKEPVIINQTISGHFGGRKITLAITDAAGENYRNATYFLNTLNDNSFENTADTKYIKKERNGIPTFAKQYVGSHTELEFLYKNRFYISLLSEMPPDELWDAFDLKSLNNL